MRNERVVLGDEGAGRTVKQARALIIPDVRPLALCLDKPEESLLLWSHRVAVETLDKIIRRQRWCYIKEVFEIDVPDLQEVAHRFPKEEKVLLLDFSTVHHGLVRHFLPRAKRQPYFFENGRRGGLRFHGLAWYCPEPK
jgi:hypothetical protein